MAQKVNPISLRLQQTNRKFDNCWSTDYFYRKLVSRDIYLQQYINSFLKLVKCPSARFSIQYSIKALKFYSFLCYPKQSRELRSKMFGLSFRKKPKKSLKKRMSFLEPKVTFSNSLSFFSKKNNKNQKRLKFLVNNYLWSHIWTPLMTSKKSRDIIINKRDDLIIFSNSKNLKNKKTRTLVSKSKMVQNSKNFEKNTKLEILKNKRLHENKLVLKNTNPFYFNTEYRKNFMKYFLIFYSLDKQFNKNIISRTSLSHVFSTSIYKDSINSLSSIKDSSKFLNQQLPAFSKIENVLNQIKCFSNFQPISLFHSTFENRNFHELLINNIKTSHQLCRKIPVNTKMNSVFSNLKHTKSQLKFKNNIQKISSKQYNIRTEIVPFIISQDWQNAGFLADEIVYFLERRIPFQRLKTRIIKKIAEISTIRGLRISFSGRVGGKSKKAQRAKIKCVKYGQTSRHTFSSRLDFAARTARTSFGTVGIKVWICYI